MSNYMVIIVECFSHGKLLCGNSYKELSITDRAAFRQAGMTNYREWNILRLG